LAAKILIAAFKIRSRRSAAWRSRRDGADQPACAATADGANEDVIKKALMRQPGVASAEPISEFTAAIDQLLGLMTGILGIVGVVTLIMAFLIAFNSTSISVDERVREIATMFAFGLPVRTVTRMQILENVITGIFGTILGMILGWLMVLALLSQDLPSLEDFNFILTFSPTTILAAIGVGVIVVGLTPIVSLRKLRRMDIPSTLRVME
jgi:putative ABC transport system permease protein